MPLLLTHIHGGVGSCNHLIQPFLFWEQKSYWMR